MKKIYVSFLLIALSTNVYAEESLNGLAESQMTISTDQVDAVSSKNVLLKTILDDRDGDGVKEEVKIESTVKVVSVYSPNEFHTYQLYLIVSDPQVQNTTGEDTRPHVAFNLGSAADLGVLESVAYQTSRGGDARPFLSIKVKKTVIPNMNKPKETVVTDLTVIVGTNASGEFAARATVSE